MDNTQFVVLTNVLLNSIFISTAVYSLLNSYLNLLSVSFVINVVNTSQVHY